MLVLTADRPNRLRDADANQAIDQQHIFGRYVRRFYEAATPSVDDGPLRHLRALACRAVAAARGPTAGPVHVNFPFDKPLEPAEPEGTIEGHAATGGRPDGAPFVRIGSGRRTLSEAELDDVSEALRTPRGVVVAGPSSEPERSGRAALELARATGFPLLADALSGARFGPADGALRMACYDLFLAEPAVAAALAPDLVVRIGTSPTSAATERWLSRHGGATQIVVDGESRWKDHLAVAGRYVLGDTADTLRALAGRIGQAPADSGWCDRWRTVEAAALDTLSSDEGVPHEGEILRAVADAMPSGATLVVSSSMPVRDLDAFARPREAPLSVLGNRGASGIDGVVSTAFGIASQRPGPVACVIGDIAFFHDQNGLLWSREPDAPVVFVLIDNDGGAIFHMLPIAAHEPHFTPYFATPHGLDLASAAALHGLEVCESTVRDVGGHLAEALEAGRTAVVRVRTERVANDARHREVREAVGAAAAGSLAGLAAATPARR